MKQATLFSVVMTVFAAAVIGMISQLACAGQAPGLASAPDIAISHHDRVYASEQFSNTVSVTDPVDNKLVGLIRLGDPAPGNFSPLYKGQVLVHGMGFSPTTARSQWFQLAQILYRLSIRRLMWSST